MKIILRFEKFWSKKLAKSWENMKKVLQYQSLKYILKIICFKQIYCYYNDPLVHFFEIEKT